MNIGYFLNRGLRELKFFRIINFISGINGLNKSVRLALKASLLAILV